MKAFVTLFKAIDGTTKTSLKINALVDYFETAPDDDKLWTVAIFTHRRPSRSVTTTLLRTWAAEMANLPLWLFEESYHIVGDLAETIALVLPPPEKQVDLSLTQIIQRLIDIKPASEEEKKAFIYDIWSHLDSDQRFIFNKLITGGFRLGVSQNTMVNALSKHLDVDKNIIAHRLMGNWSPITDTWQSLIASPTSGEDQSKPYPFYLAYALEQPIEEPELDRWTAEWKWDGIRGQIIKRGKELFVWSRGEELVTDKYPEFHNLAHLKEDFVLDGEIIPMIDGIPLPFNKLQTRIGRKKLSKKHLIDTPIFLIAYDLLEHNGIDLRNEPLSKRRLLLQNLITGFKEDVKIVCSENIAFEDWDHLKMLREDSRSYHAEGLMLKKKDSTYQTGRKRGDWWKWKVDPLEVDAIMLYAQRGHGRRANLYTDFTFAVWDGERLVTFAKAYSGLTDKEFAEVTKFVRANTIERFGPVASVKPELVFTLAFEGIAESSRHKSGVALRFPRISRWRKDKSPQDADNLDYLRGLLKSMH